MDSSFEEKSVWIMLTGLLLSFAAYFIIAGNMLREGVTAVSMYIPVMAVATVLLVVIVTIGHIVAASTRRPEKRDERDVHISWRAEHNSSWLLGLFVVLCIAGLAFELEPALIANGLLAGLFISQVARHALQIYYYRRGL